MPIFMKYDGITGDVKSAGYEKWIMLESCQFGAHRNIANTSGRGQNREASAPSVSEIVVTKKQDCASSNLFRASLWGEGKKVNIHFCKTDKDKVEKYMEIEMENVLVSSFNVSGHGGDGNDRPMESLSLNYTKITFSTTQMDDKNATGKAERAMWDQAALKGS
ncbi:MAG: type VI secretion system tube protein Hcp [Gemmataceae bacterium]|nr:type VI secretion system tube protein Hcp [Gemmataceae bacterium]